MNFLNFTFSSYVNVNEMWCDFMKCDVSSINRRRVPYHTRLKSNFDRLLYIIFFITQIHTVCLVSINEEASSKAFKKKKFWKKILRTKFKKKFWEKNFGNKVLGKKCWKQNFETKILEKKFWNKNFGKSFKKKILGKVLKKKFWVKN